MGCDYFPPSVSTREMQSGTLRRSRPPVSPLRTYVVPLLSSGGPSTEIRMMVKSQARYFFLLTFSVYADTSWQKPDTPVVDSEEL